MDINVQLRLLRSDFVLDADFRAPSNGVTALFGPSGAGKTTLLRAIAGFEQAHGEVQVGTTVWQNTATFVPVHRRSVGYVFQEPSLFEHLNVEANLRYGLKRVAKTAHGPAFDKVVAVLKLQALLDRHSEQLSGGEKQRVAIGRALLAAPSLLLMDEPLASLDIGHKRQLLTYLETLAREFNLPIFYVSHAAEEVARLADHLVLMQDGKTTASGPLSELLTNVDMPLAHDEDGAAVVTARVGSYAADYDLTELLFSGGRLLVPGKMHSGGQQQRVRIMARDVSLTLAQQNNTSILNVLPVTVIDINPQGSAQHLVRLDANGTVLLARITRKSTAILKLQPGQSVFAQIKTVALLN